MTNEQYVAKILLDYRAELDAMEIENRQRELKGFTPAYGEKRFRDLTIKYHNAIMESGV